MATIEKRILDDGSPSYRAKIRLKGHSPESATFTRLTDAKNWVQKTEADIKAGRHFGISKRYTLNDLIDSYENSSEHLALKSATDNPLVLANTREQFVTLGRIAFEAVGLINENVFVTLNVLIQDVFEFANRDTLMAGYTEVPKYTSRSFH